MSKNIKFGKKARKELGVGVNIVGDVARITIGPKGRNVCMDKGYGGPTIVNDSGSISREIVLKDPIQNMGANIIKGVAQQTNDLAGDGRTTSVIIVQDIFNKGVEKIDSKSLLGFLFGKKRANAIGIRNGINKASQVAVDYLKSISKPINSDAETTRVATISSESEEIGKIISDTISKLGKDSIITVEESPTIGISYEVAQGMEFEKGYISPYMATDPNRMECEIKNAKILVTDMKLGAVDEIAPLLDKVMISGDRELVIIAEDVVGETLNTFIINKIRGAMTILGIKAPGFGLRKKDYLEDIAVLTGATFISSEVGGSLEKITLEDLGSADRVVSTKDKTTIIGGHGKKEAIDARIQNAKNELANLESKHDKLKVEERIARLSGGVAVIKVGAATEQDTKYQKLKIEDAVNSVKAALEEGIVPGGGVALIGASKAIRGAMKDQSKNYSFDELIGFTILADALESPLRCIAENCGLGDGSEAVKKVKIMREGGGFDALTNVYINDLAGAGIIDPLKVIRLAIENASSAGGILLTTEVAMAEEPSILPKNMM